LNSLKSPVARSLSWSKAWIILLTSALLGLLTELVNLRIVSPPIIGTALENPERSVPLLSNDLTVGTYNIRYGKGLKGLENPPSLDQLAEVLASPILDVIAMNEVRKQVFSNTNQAEQIADILDQSWLYAMTAERYLAGRAGNALLSRYNIKYFKITPLIHRERQVNGYSQSKSPRNVIFALLDNGQADIALIVTHLDRGPLRIKQLEQVLSMFESHEHAILLGDLNTTQDQEQIARLLASGAIDAVCAFKVECEPHIDWILTKGFEVLDNGSHPLGLSDHPQYWARLRLIPNPADYN